MRYTLFLNTLLIIFFFSNCSPKISKVDYNKLSYEHQQLKLRYEMLKQEQDMGNTTKGEATSDTKLAPFKIARDIDLKDYEDLQRKYSALSEQYQALEKSYESVRTEQLKPRDSVPPGTVSVTTYNQLKKDYTELEEKYSMLETRYENLKVITAPQHTAIPQQKDTHEDPKKEEVVLRESAIKGSIMPEESSKEIGAVTVASVTQLDLHFSFEGYEQTANDLMLMVAVKNNSPKILKTFWDKGTVELLGNDNQTYTAKDFRVGVDFATEKGTLTKKITEEQTVFVRFSFEGVPADVKMIKTLQYTVRIDGETKTIEFKHLDLSVF